MQKAEKDVVIPVLIGGTVEFYEIYTNMYWYPLLTNHFYTFTFHFIEFFTLGMMFLLVSLSRPLGGLVFGYFGDRGSRKKQLIYSIFIVVFLNLLIPFLPVSSSWGLFFLVFLGITKCLQGFSAGGEMPAAFCLLAEAGDQKRRRFLCSFALLGPQIGQIISLTQYMLFENYLAEDFYLNWGWRISFWGAAFAGLIGWIFLGKLHEQGPHHNHLPRSVHNSISTLLRQHKKNTLLAFCISVFEVAGFFIIAFFLTDHFSKLFNISYKYSTLATIVFLIPIVLIQVFVGKLAEQVSNKLLLRISAYIVGISSIISYFLILIEMDLTALVSLWILLAGMSIQFALLPSLLTDMFPRSVRFTGIGLSFNLCNSLIGGISPLLGSWIVKKTGIEASFLLIYPFLALIFLLTLQFIPAKAVPDWE